jgi:hypothetical protein
MSILRPFSATRPTKETAAKVAALPYDVMNSEEAREMTKDNPLSFLHVDKAEIDLPESLQTIADYAFSECSRLQNVRCHATVPPTCNKIFYKTPEDMIIRVPAESLELYRTTEPWSKYDIRKIGAEGINEEVVSLGVYPNPANNNIVIATAETVVEVSVYDVYGRQHNNISASQQGNETNINISNLNNGVYFVRVKTENGEMVKRFVKE